MVLLKTTTFTLVFLVLVFDIATGLTYSIACAQREGPGIITSGGPGGGSATSGPATGGSATGGNSTSNSTSVKSPF